jgi:hypothetical protein
MRETKFSSPPSVIISIVAPVQTCQFSSRPAHRFWMHNAGPTHRIGVQRLHTRRVRNLLFGGIEWWITACKIEPTVCQCKVLGTLKVESLQPDSLGGRVQGRRTQDRGRGRRIGFVDLDLTAERVGRHVDRCI